MRYKLVLRLTAETVGDRTWSDGLIKVFIARTEDDAVEMMEEYFDSLHSSGKAVVEYKAEGWYFHN